MSALDRLAERMFGRQRLETTAAMASVDTQTYIGVATSDSADGSVSVVLSDDVTQPDNGIWDGDTFLASDELGTSVELPTTTAVREGDRVLVTASGANVMATPVVTGVVGRGDEQQAQIDAAAEAAASVEGIAQEAAAEVEQVRQDVADFRDDVATTYATKVEREDGDDAVKTWVTTNYTNSNDLATTYATKTLVSQTKDAIELAASQTYETQSDAAATYATKSALTVGLDGIRTEVAEDYQPKGDYATTASMNSAIQQSASSIESSVAATYETKSDAAATYATKTEVQQTASGLDTRITTAQSTADGAYLERTATGTTIDTTGGATIRSLVVEGQSVQDGTPTPSAPIPIKSVEGANLYDPTKAVSGYLTTSGTITGATSNNEMTSDFILIGGGNVVTVLYEVDNRAVHQPWVCVQWFKADKTFGGQLVRGTIPWDRQWMRFIIPTDGVYVRVAARHLSSGYGALAVKLGYSSFYLSDYGSIGIVSSNANVADPSNVFDSYFISTEPYSYGLQSTTALEQTMGFIPLEGAERIGFSVDGCASDMTQDTTGGFVRILFMDDNGDRVALEETIARSHFTYTASTITMNNPIAVPAGATMATICFRTYGGTPCIRLDGSNEFVEYQGTRTDIDLQGHALRSLPDGTHDEMAVDSLGRVTMTQRVESVTFDGSETWTLSGGPKARVNTNAIINLIRRPANNQEVLAAYSDHFVGATDAATYAGTVGVSAQTSGYVGFTRTGQETTVADWTAWLTANPTTVLYPLATPQTIDLGTIDLPTPADTLWLDAAIVPTMGATWWTVDGIAGQQALEAEVTERQTLIRQFSGGVLAGYVGNAIAALVNAAGSFDVVQTTWSNGVPTVTDTLARYAANLVELGRNSTTSVIEFCGGIADLAYRGTSAILRSKTGSVGIQSGTLDLYSTTQAALIASTLSTVNDGSVQIQLGSAKPRLYAIADSVYLADTSDPYTLNKEVDMYSLIKATNCRSGGVVTLWAGTKVMNVGTNVSSFTLFTKAQLQAIVGTDWTPTGANCSVFVMNGDSNATDAMMSASINSSSIVRVHMNKTRTGDTRVNYLIVRIGG